MWETFWRFFFSSRRRHTRWNCDWSSDVCSSDLGSAPKCSSSVGVECVAELSTSTAWSFRSTTKCPKPGEAPTMSRTSKRCARSATVRSEEHTSELQSQFHLVCRLLLEKKKNTAWIDVFAASVNLVRTAHATDSDLPDTGLVVVQVGECPALVGAVAYATAPNNAVDGAV